MRAVDVVFVETFEYFFMGLALLFGQVNSLSFFTGGVVSYMGILLLIWCAGHTRPGRPEDGDFSGPWQFVRHPEIVARFLLVFGVLLMARGPWLFAGAVILLGSLYRVMIRRGDGDLRKWLGPSFSMYKLFAPSFLPQFFPAKLPQHTMRVNVQESPWSAKRMLRRREFIVRLGFLLGSTLWIGAVQILDGSVLWTRVLGALVLSRSAWLVWHLRKEIPLLIMSWLKQYGNYLASTPSSNKMTQKDHEHVST